MTPNPKIWQPFFEGFKMRATAPKNFYSKNEELEFVIRPQWQLIKEQTAYVPRFSVNRKYHQIFADFPINKELKYEPRLIRKAIDYGMILLVQYRGDDDEFVQGHSRVLYPMVLGRSTAGRELLRGYHLKGWSVSKHGNIEKEWRMFRTDRILSISFTGNFFRLAPEGYNMYDRGMKGGVIQAADLNRIRQNQQTLVDQNAIQDRDEVEFDRIDSIVIDPTNTTLDLANPFDNENIDENDLNYLRLTFLKVVGRNERIAVMGALGKPGNRVKVYSGNKYLGIYEVFRSFMGNLLNRPITRQLQGQTEFDLFIFVNKK